MIDQSELDDKHFTALNIVYLLSQKKTFLLVFFLLEKNLLRPYCVAYPWPMIQSRKYAALGGQVWIKDEKKGDMNMYE